MPSISARDVIFQIDVRIIGIVNDEEPALVKVGQPRECSVHVGIEPSKLGDFR
jgi:hypothetical protein